MMEVKTMQEQIDQLRAQFSDLVDAIHDAAMQSSRDDSACDVLEKVEDEYDRRHYARIRSQAPRPGQRPADETDTITVDENRVFIETADPVAINRLGNSGKYVIMDTHMHIYNGRRYFVFVRKDVAAHTASSYISEEQ